MTTNNAALAEARAAAIDAAIEAIKAHVDDTEATMAGFPAVLKNYRATVAAVVPGILEDLRKLAAETRKAEPVKPNPFEGWTILPWRSVDLWATKGLVKRLVGQIRYMGWAAWLPHDRAVPWEGDETEARGFAAVESALIKAGATIPWQKDPTSADLIEAAGRG